MKFVYLLGFILLTGCSYKFPDPHRGTLPTSTYIYKSTTTKLPINDRNSFLVEPFNGIKDSKIIGYKLPSDTVVATFFQERMSRTPARLNAAEFSQGTVWVGGDLLCDQAEVANISWQEFLFYIKKDSINSYYKTMLPDFGKQPVQDYFTNPFFRFYPVVGVSYSQVLEYCKWRTNVVNKELEDYFNSKNVAPTDRFKLVYRLPTINEWETLAACGLDPTQFPYGVKYIKAQTKLGPKAGTYLKLKNQLEEDEQTINKSIKAFNKENPELIMFSCRNDAPYFLQHKTPSYIYNLPINNFGMYHMIGNVSEMMIEKGFSKGGSFIQPLDSCKIKINRRFDHPSSDIGFRCIVEIIY